MVQKTGNPGGRIMKKLTKEQNYKINTTTLKILLIPFIGSLLIIAFGVVEILLYTNGGN